MNDSRRNLAAALVAAAALGLAAPGARAQAMDPDAERARQLIFRIRSSMKEIDGLLLKGAQPDQIEKELAANQKRIDELLEETSSKSKAVMQGLDDLIKLSKYQQSQGGGGGGGKPPPQPKGGDEPPKQSRPKEDQPQDLAPQPQQPDPSSQPKPGEKDKKKEQPKDGKPDTSRGEQEAAKTPPPDSAKGSFERTDLSGRWGVLPAKEAEDLQRRSVEDFPQRYRAWMEAYFRRVNGLPSKGR